MHVFKYVFEQNMDVSCTNPNVANNIGYTCTHTRTHTSLQTSIQTYASLTHAHTHTHTHTLMNTLAGSWHGSGSEQAAGCGGVSPGGPEKPRSHACACVCV